MAEEIYDNRQRTPTSKTGILKAEAIFRFAQVLQQFGIETYADGAAAPPAAVKGAVCCIPGQGGGASYDYFTMLAGNKNGVKEDRMVLRFVSTALGRPVTIPGEAANLLRAAAERLKPEYPWLDARQLDQLVWQYQSKQ
jgi:hypothetical protein